MRAETVTAVDEPKGRLQKAGYVRQILLWATALLLALGMVYYYLGVLLPLRRAALHVGSGTKGAWSDLYHEWFAARELLWYHRNPYSREVTEDIERGFYGVDRFNAKQFGYTQAFAYPVYVVFLFAPFLHLSFGAVRVVFAVAFLALTVASVPLWIRGLKFELRSSTAVLALLFAVSSYPVVDGLMLQQLTMLVAGLIAGSMAALAGGNLVLAGVLLALAMIKPHLVILVAEFLLVWTLGDWRARKRFAVTFVGLMSVILIASELLLPGWIRSWQQLAHSYVQYVKPSLLASLLGQTGAMIAGAVVVLLCLGLFWYSRKATCGSDRFNFAVVVALVLTILLVPAAGGANYNQVLLIPAAIWLCIPARKFAESSPIARATWLLAVFTLAGEWVLALAVSFAGLVLHHRFEREATFFVAGPDFLMYFFPLTLALFVLTVAPQVMRRANNPAAS